MKKLLGLFILLLPAVIYSDPLISGSNPGGVPNGSVTPGKISSTPSTAYVFPVGAVVQSSFTVTNALEAPNAAPSIFSWWRADDLSVADGADVSSWSDFTGNGNTLTPASSNKPILKTRVLNGHNVVRFSGAIEDVTNNDALHTGNVTMAQPFTYIAVVGGNVPNPANHTTIISNEATGSALLLYLITSHTLILNAGTQLTGNVATTGPAIISAVFNGTSSKLRVNGIDSANGNAGTDGYAAQKIMLSSYGSNLGMKGDIAEVAIYSAALSTNDIVGVEAYLSKKYNIAVTSGIIQTADMFDAQSSTGAILSGVESKGRFMSGMSSVEPIDTPTPGTMSWDSMNQVLWVYQGPSSISANGGGWENIGPLPLPISAIRKRTPKKIGEEVFCINCTTDGVCISTGTGVAAYTRISAVTTPCQ